MTVGRRSGTLVEMIRALDFSNIPMDHASNNPWSRKEKNFDGDLPLPTRIEFGSIMKGVDGPGNKKEEHCYSLQKQNAPFNHRGGSDYNKGNEPHYESAVKHFSTGHPRLNQRNKILPR